MPPKGKAPVNPLPAHVASLLQKIHHILEQSSSDSAILDLGASTDASRRLKKLFLFTVTESISHLYDAIKDETQPDRTDDSLVVAAPTSFVAGYDWDEYLEEGNTSLTFDVLRLDAAETLHDFLLTTHITRPTFDLDTDDVVMHRLARPPRAVEMVPPDRQLIQLIYLDSLPSRMHDFLQAIHGENLEDIRLNDQMTRRLSAGPSIANSSKKMRSEADVEFLTQADMVSEGINLLRRLQHEAGANEDPLYPQKGTPVRSAGQPSHAFADIEIGKGVVEVKTSVSIGKTFMMELLGLEPGTLKSIRGEDAVGIVFEFHPPQSPEDTISSTVQSVVQLWAQLLEKSFSFGQGTSHEYSYFVVRDPQTPGRLIISPCFPTFSNADSPCHPSESGIYTMYNMFRIANNPHYSERFLQELRADLNKPDALVEGSPRLRRLPPTTDLSKGTVGVKNVPNAKEGALRDHPKHNYKDVSHSLIDESVLQGVSGNANQQWANDIPSLAIGRPGPSHSTPNNRARTANQSGAPEPSGLRSRLTGAGSASAIEQPSRVTRSRSGKTRGQKDTHRGGNARASGSKAVWK
ncbi:hypothetical protein DFH07DRAFT_969754 [Mycena maculata]|uniref:Uncharacterized protein n=1 Tax=Mycena maculata TaxID=230809 RepID=A0AAD7MQR8_9AGAR|nr:hypothetical protein DFH07DRAFT_969754 [Mycena maculata]